jgi:hypothetical protein
LACRAIEQREFIISLRIRQGVGHVHQAVDTVLRYLNGVGECRRLSGIVPNQRPDRQTLSS